MAVNLPKGRTRKQVLAKVQSEMIQAQMYMNPKKARMADDVKLYNDPTRDDEEKIRINLAFANIRTLMALSITDQITVKYIGQTMSDFMRAENWNKLADDMYRSTGMTMVNIESKEDRFRAWVAIRSLDVDGNDIIVSAEDPMQWLPDPRGCYHSERFRWHGFKKFKTKTWMEDMKFEHIDCFRTLRGQSLYDWDNYVHLGNNRQDSVDIKINEYAVYQHMGIFDGKKYIGYFNDEVTEIAWMMAIEDFLAPVEDLTLGMKGDVYPLTLSYRCPQKNNPLGISVMDLERDKQLGLSKLANLAMQRAIRVSLGWHKFFNENLLKNKNDIKNLGTKPKVIGLNLKNTDNIQNVMYEQPISVQQPQENYNMQEVVQYWAKKPIAVDDNSQWLVNPNGQTATETVTAQASANLLASFGNLLDYLADAELAFKWQRMKSKVITKKQIVTILNPLGNKALTFTKNDLKISKIVNVKIVSKADSEMEAEKTVGKMMQLIPFIQEIGWYPYRKFTRDIVAKWLGSEEDAELYVEKMPEEFEAKDQIQLLNDNIDLAPVTNIDTEDHIAYIQWYAMADDTPAKEKAIQARLEAQKQKLMNRIQQQQMQPEQGVTGNPTQTQQNQGLQNQAMWAITNASIQEQNKWITTIAWPR